MLYIDVIGVVFPVVSVEEVEFSLLFATMWSIMLYQPLLIMLNIYSLKLYVNNTAYIVCSVYIPPGSPIPVYESFMSAAQYAIDSNPGSVFIFSGDFNLPDLSWSNDDFGLIYSSYGLGVHCVPDIFSFNNFF